MTTAATTKLEPAEVLIQGLALLGRVLPSPWQLTEEKQEGGTPQPDAAIVRLDLGNSQLRMLVEGRAEFTPRDASAVLGGRTQLLRSMAGQLAILIIAPWLSPQTRERLAAQNINYLDLAGNLRIFSEYPPAFLEREVPRDRGPRTGRSGAGLAGVKAGGVVRLLADVAPPYGTVELSEACGVTRGYMSRLLDALDREGLIDRGKRGVVESVDVSAMLRRRAEVYSVFQTNQVKWYLCPNGPGFARETLGDLARTEALPSGTMLTGSFGSSLIAPVAASALLAVYATSPLDDLVETARLLPADEGANVAILTPYDRAVTERPFDLPVLTSLIPVVGASQLALDCLTGTGRMPAEGEALLDWMVQNPLKWQRRSLAELG